MGPLTDRSQAKDSGFAQVRSALSKFKGTVASAEFGIWGGELIDPNTGKKKAPREFLEVTSVDVEVLEVTEDLSMEIDEWNFRVNCSEYNGSFWVDKFLASADEHKVQIPEGLVGKVVTWVKDSITYEFKDGNTGKAESFVIESIEDGATPVATKPKPAVKPKATKAAAPATEAVDEEAAKEAAEEPAGETEVVDQMEMAIELAVGKTEAQFKSAISVDERFAQSPLLSLAKAGMVTLSLVNESKLVKVGEGAKATYALPE